MTRSAVIVALLAVLTLPGTARAADTIKVGYLGPQTGIFAQAGRDMLDGLKMAFEQTNYQAGGRKIELIEEDTEGNPATAQTKYRKLVAQDRINVLAGVLLVNIGYALVPPIERDRLPALFLTTPDPRLRVCLAHLGGAVPFLRERIVIGFKVGRDHFGAAMGITASPERYIERFYLDSVSYYDPAMLAGIACVGIERIVMGSDAPFAVGDLARSVAAIRALPGVDARDRERILGENAVRFLTGR